MRRVGFLERGFFRGFGLKKVPFVLPGLKSYAFFKLIKKIDLPKRIQYHSEKHEFS